MSDTAILLGHDNLVEQMHGQKVTMLIQNTMGATVLRHIRVDQRTHIYETKHDSWSTPIPGICLYYVLKGKRKVEAYRICSEQTKLALALGWQTIEEEGLVMEEGRNRGEFSISRRISDSVTTWEAFGTEWEEAVKQLKQVSYCHY